MAAKNTAMDVNNAILGAVYATAGAVGNGARPHRSRPMQTAEQNPKTTTRKGKPAWVITDDSACKQKGRQLAPGVFEFKEKRGFMGKVKATITLADYDEERRNYYSEAYYGTLSNLKVQNGPDWEWILAEIIFEQLPL